MAVRFDDRFLAELKARLRPSDVIGRTVKLRKQGREFVGLSPFNKEKTPSFYVNDEKGQFFDFSSGKTGDLISFIQETERLTFHEAVERLAHEAGLALPASDPQVMVAEKRRQGLSDWLELAAQWFEAELNRPSAREARAYLERRGLPEGDWRRFRLGFAPPGRTTLKDYLIAKGARPSELVEAGLLIAPDDGGAPYDRFRDRIIFPILDVRGRVVSFGGRAMDPAARAKYLNGPETTVFHKGSNLYGLSEARKILAAARDSEPAGLVVVEGYMDVIACQRAGIAAVAPMGTALTEEQMEMLWRYHAEPTLCFDGDAAGMRASDRVIDRALPLLKAGRSFKFAFVRGGKDPDDVLREHGAAALRAQLGNAVPFVERLFEREVDAEPLDTPERRAGLKARLRQLSASIADKDLAELYRSELFDRFYARFNRRTFSREASKLDFVDGFKGLLDKSIADRLAQRIRQFNAAVAIAALDHPHWVSKYVEEFAHWGFGDARLAPLVQPLLDALQEDQFDRELVTLNLRSEGAAKHAEAARAVALEAGNYPFLRDPDAPGAQAAWERCFEALLQLTAIEEERRERSEAFKQRKPVPEGHNLFERGMWLRKQQLALAAAINSGELWLHEPGRPKKPVLPH